MNKVKHFAVRSLAFLLMGAVAGSLYAQLPAHLREYPLTERKAGGDLVAPVFNGWIANEDGSVTLMFGFANRNREQIVDIPLGPNNYLEPAQFDGVQPTHFPIYDRGGFVGINERGAFAVTVPADMAGTEVVWTLKNAGYEYSIPGRATSTTYEMSAGERAFGTLKPAIRFDLNGPESNDMVGIYAPRVSTKVGQPVTLKAYMQDRGSRHKYPEDNEMFFYPLGTEWILHQGPAVPDFDPAWITGSDRKEGDGLKQESADDWVPVETEATFSEPGDYVIRLRVDNFSAPDSQFDNVCCWSNAYVPVTVTP
jgi:hypothetical protein